MWELFVKGGPIMYLLLLCSMIGVYIVVQKFIFLRVHYVSTSTATNIIKDQLISSGKEATLKELRTHRKIMLKVLSSAIKLSGLPREDIQDGIKEAIYPEMPKLESNMPLLSAVITVTPILGLLGTVLGLMDIFSVISGGGIGDTAALSGGIAQALITTVTGLGIAIPFIFFYQYLNHRIEVFTIEMEHLIYDIITFCKANKAVKP